MIVKDTHIELIATKNAVETPGYRSINFRRPANFVFESGDWIDIGFEGRTLNGGITYSIASSPTESDIQITFREGVSEFKKALQSIESGERLYISQYGNDYDFRLKANQSSVLIAGGVGIAPFRSMLKEMYDNNNQNEVSLIYFYQSSDFLFKAELDRWTAHLPGAAVTYISTNNINRRKREKLLLTLISNPNQNFYISGPPAMVDSTEHLLTDNGVQVRNIRIDSFGGY